MTANFGNFVPNTQNQVTKIPTKYVKDQAFGITFLGWIIELLTIQGKYSEVPNKRSCSIRYFRYCLLRNLPN